MDPKVLEGAISLAQTLSGWALLMLAGSILSLIGTSYRRPADNWRWMYLLFLPGWGCLVLSIHSGVAVQRVYLAYVFSQKSDIKGVTTAITEDAFSQLSWMQVAVFFFGVWLVIYLVWWLLD